MFIYFSSHGSSLIGLPFPLSLLSIAFVHVTCAVFCCRLCGRIFLALIRC